MKSLCFALPDSFLRLALGMGVLLTGVLASTPGLAATVPDNIVYNALTQKHEPALPNRLTAKRGASFRVTVINLNPLYRLKTKQEQLVLNYTTANPFALAVQPPPAGRRASKCDLNDLVARLDEAQRYTIKLLGNFEQVRSWAGTTALDEKRTHDTLTVLTKEFARLAGNASTGKLSALEIELAAATWADSLSQLAAVAVAQAKLVHDKASKCPVAVQQQSDQLVRRAQLLQARFQALAGSKDLARLALYWTILRDAPYSQQSGPVLVLGDRVLLTLEVVKRDDFAELPPPQWDTPPLTIHAVGFVTMDISAGLLFNGLRDHSYSLRDSIINVQDTLKASPRYKRVQENSSSGPRLGLVSLLHVRYKAAPNFSTGPAIGVTATDTKSILQYHAGWSFLFGDRQRIVLTAGWSWGEVRRIREDFTVGGRVPVSLTEVPTRLVRDNSLLVAVTYNITSTLTKLVQTADK